MSRIASEPRLLALLLIPALVLGACSTDGPTDPGEDDDLEIVDTVSVELAVDSGEVGLVIDAREVARRGYEPTEAQVSFPAHAGFNQTLAIDPITNLAVLKLTVEDLTDTERDAFAAGVAVDIVIVDAAQAPLGELHETSRVLDDSNLPVGISTTLPSLGPPLVLKPGVPYLLQPEGLAGVMTSFASDAYTVSAWIPNSPQQQFYFTVKAGSPDPNTYLVEHQAGYAEGTSWTVDPGTKWIYLSGGGTPAPAGGPHGFVLEQDEDGWVRVRVEGTSDYVSVSGEGGGVLKAVATEPSRFRLITDDIRWALADRGTVYHDPIVPPAQVDFAYEATIRNCSEATLTETVGRAETRTRTPTTTTSESLQLFSSDEVGGSIKVGVEVGASVQGVGEVSGSVEVTGNYTYTTSETTTTENTLSESTETASEVSRTRELALPPHSAVEVYDAVRTIRNVRIPFSQVLRITATYKSSGAVLTGPEILTQLRFNGVEGVPAEIGANYLDLSLRGQVVVDQMMEAETDAKDIPGACD